MLRYICTTIAEHRKLTARIRIGRVCMFHHLQTMFSKIEFTTRRFKMCYILLIGTLKKQYLLLLYIYVSVNYKIQNIIAIFIARIYACLMI